MTGKSTFILPIGDNDERMTIRGTPGTGCKSLGELFGRELQLSTCSSKHNMELIATAAYTTYNCSQLFDKQLILHSELIQ